MALMSVLFVAVLHANEKVGLILQPLGQVDASFVELARIAIEENFGIGRIEVNAPLALPESAFYRPRERYRAERLLTYLDGLVSSGDGKIVGLTAVDISTTKGPYEDWGIFGMADLGGRSCVVSSYRLARGRTEPPALAARIKKVVTHEVGHVLGLWHCPTPGCVMQDALGKIATVDRSDGRPCQKCRKALGLIQTRTTRANLIIGGEE